MSEKLRLALLWRDYVEEGEFIETDKYKATHMGFGRVTQRELDAICAGANAYYKAMGSALRIGNDMGVLLPEKETP